MYFCVENFRKGIYQNVSSDYLWVVDFMGDFVLFFLLSVFSDFLNKEHISGTVY